MQRITERVSFHCARCQSDKLEHPGAARTDENRLYLVFTCEGCGEQVPIEMDKIIAELYRPNVIMAEGARVH